MTLIITVYVKEGIVMASDSRISFNLTQNENSPDGMIQKTVQNLGIHYSDSAEKLFVTNSGVGISTCGGATINNSPIAGYMDAFVRENDDTPVDAIPQKLYDYLHSLDPTLNSEFHIAGYAIIDGKCVQRVYRLQTSNQTNQQKVETLDTNEQGATWNGQTDILSRLIAPLYLKCRDENGTDSFHPHAGYGILWNYFNLQDAVDFAEYAIKTTIDTIRFEQRPKNVGGPIDILVLQPGSKPMWLAKKQLHVSSICNEGYVCGK